MEFSKEDLQRLAWEDYDLDIYEVLEDEIVDTSRWSNIYEMVFRVKETGLLYATSYSRGATEMQDESPYEWDKDTIECDEVVETKVEVVRYVRKEK